MINLLLISTSYRIRDLIQVDFAFGQRVKWFSIDRKETGVGDIQGLLAHQSPKTTEVYTHVSKKSLANIKNPLDDITEQQSNDSEHITGIK